MLSDNSNWIAELFRFKELSCRLFLQSKAFSTRLQLNTPEAEVLEWCGHDWKVHRMSFRSKAFAYALNTRFPIFREVDSGANRSEYLMRVSNMINRSWWEMKIFRINNEKLSLECDNSRKGVKNPKASKLGMSLIEMKMDDGGKAARTNSRHQRAGWNKKDKLN